MGGSFFLFFYLRAVFFYFAGKKETMKSTNYEEFVEKFKPKKTTDDCYTPPLVYDALLDWAREYLPIEGMEVVRPFWPGGDYERYDYPENCVVVDNPPFSIFSKIVGFYTGRGIPFLLFCPGLTGMRPECTFIGAGMPIVYENGACVNTSFVTNLMGDTLCCSAPELRRRLKKTNDKQLKAQKKTLARLSFPDCVLRASTLHAMSLAGVSFSVGCGDGCVVGHATQNKGGEYGNSVLLSDRKTAEKLAAKKLAAEKLAAEKLADEKLQLTERSMEIIRELNGDK